MKNVNKAKHNAACFVEAMVLLDELAGFGAQQLAKEALDKAGVNEEELNAAVEIVDKLVTTAEIEEIIKKRALRNIVRYAKEIVEYVGVDKDEENEVEGA